MLLLDTNLLSELRRKDKADPKVLAWANGVYPNDLFLSAITILEIELGMLLKARTDPAAGEVLRTWIRAKRCCPLSKGASWPLTKRWQCGAPPCTFRTPSPSATPSLQPPHPSIT